MSIQGAQLRLSAPDLTQAELADLAAKYPELHPQIRNHPLVYPDLVAWIDQQVPAAPVFTAAADPAVSPDAPDGAPLAPQVGSPLAPPVGAPLSSPAPAAYVQPSGVEDPAEKKSKKPLYIALASVLGVAIVGVAVAFATGLLGGDAEEETVVEPTSEESATQVEPTEEPTTELTPEPTTAEEAEETPTPSESEPSDSGTDQPAGQNPAEYYGLDPSTLFVEDYVLAQHPGAGTVITDVLAYQFRHAENPLFQDPNHPFDPVADLAEAEALTEGLTEDFGAEVLYDFVNYRSGVYEFDQDTYERIIFELDGLLPLTSIDGYTFRDLTEDTVFGMFGWHQSISDVTTYLGSEFQLDTSLSDDIVIVEFDKHYGQPLDFEGKYLRFSFVVSVATKQNSSGAWEIAGLWTQLYEAYVDDSPSD